MERKGREVDGVTKNRSKGNRVKEVEIEVRLLKIRSDV